LNNFITFFSSSKKNLFYIFFAIIVGAFDFVGFGLFYPLINLLTENSLSIDSNLQFLDQFIKFINPSESINILIIIISVILLIKALFTLYYHATVISASINYINKIRNGVFDNFIQSVFTHESTQSSRIVNAISQQGNLAVGALYLCFQIIQNISIVVACCLLALLLSWKIFLLSLIIGILLYFIFKPSFSYSKLLGDKIALINEKLSSIILMIVGHMAYIKSVECGKTFSEKLHITILDLKKTQIKFTVLNRFTSVMCEPLAVIVFGVVICVGIEFGEKPEALALQAFMMHRVFSKAMPLLSLFQNFKSQSASLQYCIDLHHDSKQLELERRTGTNFIKLSKSIDFQNVTLSYGKKNILENINITFPANKITVILGESGIGKSTLINCITGLIYPENGVIKIDDINLNEYAINSVRKKIGYVSQDIIVFPGSLFENLSIRNPSVDESQIFQLIDKFKLTGIFSNDQPNLDFVINENATKLSGGQKQRIAIIRELVANPNILILDEPTSALDEDLQKIFVNYLEELKQNVTIIIVTHQKELLSIADKSYLVESGAIRSI
jgi:ABC-type bacteriocin/lantibiotic exporter with double-glycine peptidase domain